MYPPTWVCGRLVKIAPLLRLGWVGRPPTPVDVINPGNFALVGLVPACYLYNPELLRRVFVDFWNLQSELNGTNFKHFERGPVFNRLGGTSPDWDVAGRIPVFKGYLSNDDVMTGKVLLDIPNWIREAKKTGQQKEEEEKERKRKVAKESNRLIEEGVKEAVDWLWWDAMQPGSDSTTMAKEFADTSYKQRKDNGDYEFTEEDAA